MAPRRKAKLQDTDLMELGFWPDRWQPESPAHSMKGLFNAARNTAMEFFAHQSTLVDSGRFTEAGLGEELKPFAVAKLRALTDAGHREFKQARELKQNLLTKLQPVAKERDAARILLEIEIRAALATLSLPEKYAALMHAIADGEEAVVSAAICAPAILQRSILPAEMLDQVKDAWQTSVSPTSTAALRDLEEATSLCRHAIDRAAGLILSQLNPTDFETVQAELGIMADLEALNGEGDVKSGAAPKADNGGGAVVHEPAAAQ